MSAGNQEKTRQAPVTVIVAYDTQFHEQLPKLFPHVDARSWYAGDQARINAAALMNSSLQGGYLVIAARALGLDCGPMGGFDADKVNATFFPTASGRSTSSATSAMAIPARCIRAIRA